MKVLIVEDDEEKALEIKDAIYSTPGIGPSDVTTAVSIIEAKQAMIQHQFDLLVLDIQLPLRNGEQPKTNGGALLLKQVMVGRRFNLPPFVIGITAFEFIEDEVQQTFADNTTVILTYNRASATWRTRLINRIEQILARRSITDDADEEASHTVVLIHGIRTQASWAEMVAAVLEHHGDVTVVPIRYGFFDTFRFLFPVFTRNAPVRRVVRELRDLRADHPEANISVIAHSFGSYVVSKVLRVPDIRLHRVIFCGCIVPTSFRRAQYRGQLGSDPILNDCGSNDIWPILAASITWGFGSSGTFGFGTAGIRDRFNRVGHNDLFNKQFVEQYWVPFILHGQILDTQWEQTRPSSPYWQSVLQWLPLKYILVVALIFMCYFGCRRL